CLCGQLKQNNLIVIHFGEIWLKGRNRGNFVKQLYQNIKLAIRDEKYDSLENARDRFVLHLLKTSDMESINKKLEHVFGISWFAPVIITTNKIPDIMKTAAKLYGKNEKVRVEVKRSFKGLKFNSQELVSVFLKNKKKFPFILDRDGDKELFINLTKERCMIIKEKIRGAGGLPVGSSGKAIILLSGGIDSPVASIYAMKKGLIPIYLHVHAYPKNETSANSKMKTLLKTMRDYYKDSKVYFVPSYIFQAATIKTPKEYELVLFKRFIYKLAEKIAVEEGAEVIATGESLGQVASQTVKNLIATERGMKIFVMRPLIAFDKQEIVNEAKRIGTYEISIKEYPDVCSIRARNPSTAARFETIDKLYKQCKLDSIVTKSIKKSLILQK
ncbi:MAG: tRNA uracil 4-sulfurtransferase ThiI, partial [Candidatus Micrarchaeales archaeon]